MVMRRSALLWLVFVASGGGHVSAETLYVDQKQSSASAQTRVFTSIAAAVKQLRPGDELVLKPGIYREPILLEGPNKGTPRRGLTIRGEDRERVIIKGSDVVDDFQHVRDDVYVKNRLPLEPQQVFVNGALLRQVGGTVFEGYPEDRKHPLYKQFGDELWPSRISGDADDMPERSFFYDHKTQSLYVRLSAGEKLAGNTIEVSVRPFLLKVKGWENVTVRDLTFQHATTSTFGRNGAVSLWGDGHTLERLNVFDVDSLGLHLVGDNITVSDCNISRSGRLGVAGRGRNHLYQRNTTNSNNVRAFAKGWEAGGMKFVGEGGLKDSIVTEHTALYNNAQGIWFDWMNDGNVISKSISAYNEGHGIFYEASTRAIIWGNVTFGNLHRGIYLPHSSNSRVACNLAAFNGMEGIVVVDGGKRTEEMGLVAEGNSVLGNVIAWNNRKQPARPALILPSANDTNRSDFNVFVSDHPHSKFSRDWPKLTNPLINGIAKWRENSRQDTHSAEYQIPVPAQIQNAYGNRSDIDWNTLESVASRQAFAESADASRIGCSFPGPFALANAHPRNP